MENEEIIGPLHSSAWATGLNVLQSGLRLLSDLARINGSAKKRSLLNTQSTLEALDKVKKSSEGSTKGAMGPEERENLFKLGERVLQSLTELQSETELNARLKEATDTYSGEFSENPPLVPFFPTITDKTPRSSSVHVKANHSTRG